TNVNYYLTLASKQYSQPNQVNICSWGTQDPNNPYYNSWGNPAATNINQIILGPRINGFLPVPGLGMVESVTVTNLFYGKTYLTGFLSNNTNTVSTTNFVVTVSYVTNSAGGSGAVTNLGVASANIAYLSQSAGVVSPVVGNPNMPFLTAQSAANACPDGGTVAVMDGTFNETVTVTNCQHW